MNQKLLTSNDQEEDNAFDNVDVVTSPQMQSALRYDKIKSETLMIQ